MAPNVAAARVIVPASKGMDMEVEGFTKTKPSNDGLGQRALIAEKQLKPWGEREVLRARGSSEAAMPARVAVGFAYVKRRYTFSADASVNFARDVRLSYDMTAQAIAGQGTPPAVPNVTLSPGVQPNVNLGASVPFGPTKEVNIGFFTDFSSVSDEDVKRIGSSRVHMFGGSMSLGLLGKQSRAWIGLAGEIGHATAKVPGRDFNYQGGREPPGRPAALGERGHGRALDDDGHPGLELLVPGVIRATGISPSRPGDARSRLHLLFYIVKHEDGSSYPARGATDGGTFRGPRGVLVRERHDPARRRRRRTSW